MYRERLKQYACLIGDREPIVLQRQLPGMGRAMRYIITNADDARNSPAADAGAGNLAGCEM